MAEILHNKSMTQTSFIAVARTDGFAPDTAKLVEAGGRTILIAHSGGDYFAVANLCSHAEEPLLCGRVKRGWIACPAHGARFDLATGEVLGPPATEPIETFPLRIVEGMIEVAV
ncbi:MAG: non-heme iron oxygenase ferredoxin subunit [Sphingomicrobium sp.]